MVDVKEAFSYPFQDDQWLKKVAIGTAIMLVFGVPKKLGIPIALNALIAFNTTNIFKALIALIVLVPTIWCLGYQYVTLKRILKNDKPYMPEWSSFRQLFLLGVKVFVIILIYYSIPFVLFQIGSYLSYFNILRDNHFLFRMLAVAFYYCGGILGLFVFFLFPMAIVSFAKGDEKFKAVFALSDIFKKIAVVFGNYLIIFVIFLLFFFLFKVFTLIALLALFYMTLVLVGLTGLACLGAFKETEVPISTNSNETK